MLCFVLTNITDTTGYSLTLRYISVTSTSWEETCVTDFIIGGLMKRIKSDIPIISVPLLSGLRIITRMGFEGGASVAVTRRIGYVIYVRNQSWCWTTAVVDLTEQGEVYDADDIEKASVRAIVVIDDTRNCANNFKSGKGDPTQIYKQLMRPAPPSQKSRSLAKHINKTSMIWYFAIGHKLLLIWTFFPQQQAFFDWPHC